MSQFSLNQNAEAQLAGLNLKIKALQGNESGFLNQIDSLRQQLAGFENIKLEHSQLSTQNQFLNGQTNALSSQLSEFEKLRLEVVELRNMRASFDVQLKSQYDGFN